MVTLIPIPLPICHAFLLEGERPVLIDTGRPQDAARIEAALKRHGVELAELALILHTHGHWDHCGSTAELRRRTTAAIAIHRADAALLEQGNNGRLSAATLSGRLLKPFLDRRYPGTKPSVLIEEDIDLASYGVAAKVIHTPGHTEGSISVITAEGDVVIGDLLMGGFIGGRMRAGRPGFHYFAQDRQTLLGSVRKLLALGPRRLYPAHGGPLAPLAVSAWLERVSRRFGLTAC